MADFMLRKVDPVVLREAKAKAGGPGPLADRIKGWLAYYVRGAQVRHQGENSRPAGEVRQQADNGRGETDGRLV